MTEKTRGPRGLFRPGHGGHAETMFKPGDPGNPRTRAKRMRAAGREPNAKQALKREAMRAELVALDVLERLLNPARQATAPRLPRLPSDPKAARREADRLAARSMTRALRSMQRIARDPHEPAELRAQVARLLLERGPGLPGMRGADEHGEKDAPKKERPIIVVSPVPRKTDAQRAAELKPIEPAAKPPATPTREVPEPWREILEREAEELRTQDESPEKY